MPILMVLEEVCEGENDSEDSPLAFERNCEY
jgi:hypothetical protein